MQNVLPPPDRKLEAIVLKKKNVEEKIERWQGIKPTVLHVKL